MAQGLAPAAPVALDTTQVSAPKPYDPTKTVDGMFKGSVIRMAYAFKDPKNFGESTKVIISECTKKYQDALDDCEIQLLDAKWYLEQKLAENKARRDVKAKEVSAATAKRKHEEAAEKDTETNIDSPPKRAKANEQPSPRPTPTAQNLSNIKDQPKAKGAMQTGPSLQQIKTEAQPTKLEEKKPPTPQPPVASQVQKQSTKPQADTALAPADDFPRQTPNVTPAITNDDFTFESMFPDALGDGDGDGMDDLNIGLDEDPFGDSFDSSTLVNDTSANTQATMQAQIQTQNTQRPSSNTLLEGVEQFANQPDDAPKPSNTNGNTNTNTFTSDLDMGTNIFDSFLNDKFDVGSDSGGNDFGDFANDDVGDVNFDELFGNGT